MDEIEITIKGITRSHDREFKFADISNVRLASGTVMSFVMCFTEGSYDDMVRMLETGKRGLFGFMPIKNLLNALTQANQRHPERNQELVIGFLSSTEGSPADHKEGTRLIFQMLEKKNPHRLFVLFHLPDQIFLKIMEEVGAEQLLDRLS